MVNQLEHFALHSLSHHGVASNKPTPFQIVKNLRKPTVVLKLAQLNQFQSRQTFFLLGQQFYDLDIALWLLEKRGVQHAELVIKVAIS